MALTFDEIKRIVFSFQKARDANVQESTVEAAIYSAIDQICRVPELPGTQWDSPPISTVAGTYAYNFNTQVAKVLMVEIKDSDNVRTELAFKSWDDMKRLRQGSEVDDPALPVYWTVWQGQLVVYPTPDKAYTLYVAAMKKPSGLDVIPEAYRDAVVNGALAFFAPEYIPVFEKSKQEVQAYWEDQAVEQLSFEADSDVEAHYDVQRKINVV